MVELSAEGIRLRQRVGETIPEGKTEADTLFKDTDIEDLLSEAGGSLDIATLLAWEVKAAALANLVNVQEGSSRRDLSNLHKQALDQVKHWREVNVVSVTSGTKIRDITRT